ncbi:hypothetical protein [Acinetobacter sp. CWB-B33]|uniref:hypothetical protein n=1 Tax=Acinetobacter sp. CWB-B33 TaxID=2815724 RepID=UPI0031FF125E
MITYNFVIWFVGFIFGAKVSLKISLLVLLIILLKLQSRRRYAKYFDAKISRYIKKQDKDGLNKYKMILMMLGVYISISVLGLLVYRVSGNELSTSNKSDIINIFVWATYLLAPIVAIWVYSDWKDPYKLNKKVKIIDDIEAQILGLETCSRQLNEIINEYLEKNSSNKSEIQLKYNEFTRKMANIDILSRQILMNEELMDLSKDLDKFNYYFVQYSIFPSSLLSIIKGNDVDHWSESLNKHSISYKLTFLKGRDDREKWLSHSYGQIYEIQKKLIEFKNSYFLNKKAP